jgi:hypothetical protein
MWPLLETFQIPTVVGIRVELPGTNITDDPKYHSYSLEFFALDPLIVGEAAKTNLVWPLEDGRELYVWVRRLQSELTRVTYQELFHPGLGWQAWIVTTLVPREDVKRETALLLDGLPLFDKSHEWSNGYSREEISKILFDAAEMYADSDRTQRDSS